MTGERQFGPYRLIRQIAVGGMAEIHLAKTKGIAGFEKYVALKMIHPNLAEDDEFIDMLVDEAKIAVQLTHGNIAQTFDLGRVGETYYITMEYVDGADLYRLLRRGSEQDLEMPFDVCAFVAKEVAAALDYAHRKRDHAGTPLGIVHRDVSPQNVLVSYAGEIKLVDFGIAKASMKARQTAAGVIKGKYYYMSPEQASGQPTDHRSDIFSAGIVLYEMITGQMMYLEEDMQRLIEMARAAAIPWPSTLRKDIPPPLERIVMTALARSPADRYQSASDLGGELERFLHGHSPAFTAAKVSALVKTILGDPVQVSHDQDLTNYDLSEPSMDPFTVDTSELVHERGELQDDNSVLFRMTDLADELGSGPLLAPAHAPSRTPSQGARVVTREHHVPPTPYPLPPAPPGPKTPLPPAPSGGKTPVPPAPSGDKPKTPVPPQPRSFAANAGGNVTRPHIVPPTPVPVAPERSRTPLPPPPSDVDAPTSRPSGLAKKRAQSQPRALDEATKILADAEAAKPDEAGEPDVAVGANDDRTLISQPVHGFTPEVDHASDAVDATVVSPSARLEGDTLTSTQSPGEDEDFSTDPGRSSRLEETAHDDYDGPTVERDFSSDVRRGSRPRASQPPALEARIHAPAVSEIREPRRSRRTPPHGEDANVLKLIVNKEPSEPMPSPRPSSSSSGRSSSSTAAPRTSPPSSPGRSSSSTAAPRTSPPSSPGRSSSRRPASVPPPLPASSSNRSIARPSAPPPAASTSTPQALHAQHPAPAATKPAAVYAAPPAATAPPRVLQQRASVTDPVGHDRLARSDPPRRGLLAYVVAGVLALSIAATVTFVVIRLTRTPPAGAGRLVVSSTPPGAEVVLDGRRMPDRTPMTITGIATGGTHELRIELPGRVPFVQTFDFSRGPTVQFEPVLEPMLEPPAPDPQRER